MSSNLLHHDRTDAPVAFDEATVADAMSRGIISCTPETPLRTVATMMSTYGVHAVFVLEHRDEDDEDSQLWGVVSDLDLVAAARAGLSKRTAGEASVTPLVTVASDNPLASAAELMAEYGNAHLAVIDPDTGRPVGVVSTLDVVRAVAAGRGARETQASA